MAWILLWAPATLLLGFAPILFMLAGLGDDATRASRRPAPARSRRSSSARSSSRPARSRARAPALIAYAAVVLEIARRLGTAVAIEGDAEWTLYRGATFAGWAALSA